MTFRKLYAAFACVLMLRPISPELVLFPDVWVSNIPRFFQFTLIQKCICNPELIVCKWFVDVRYQNENIVQHLAKWTTFFVITMRLASYHVINHPGKLTILWLYNPIEKGGDLTQSCDKNPYTHRKSQNATWQHKTPPNLDYTTVANQYGRSVGVTTATQPVWLNRLTNQTLPFYRKICVIKRTHNWNFVNNPPYEDRGRTGNQRREAIKSITQTCKVI